MHYFYVCWTRKVFSLLVNIELGYRTLWFRPLLLYFHWYRSVKIWRKYRFLLICWNHWARCRWRNCVDISFHFITVRVVSVFMRRTGICWFARQSRVWYGSQNENSKNCHKYTVYYNILFSQVYVTAFGVSRYASTLNRGQRKPFVPLEGETYENKRDDLGWWFIAEQVFCSHHAICTHAFVLYKKLLSRLA